MKLNRRWHRALPLVAAMLIGACSTDSALAPTDLNLKKDPPPPNVNGPVWILGEFSFDITIGGGDPGVNNHPQDKGTCRQANGTVSGNTADNTVWFNSQGNATNAKFCEGGAGGTTTLACEIDPEGLPATYAFGTGGQGAPTGNQTSNNENLNFHSDLIPWQLDQFVHYGAPTRNGQKGNTTAKDWTAFTFTCEDGTEGDGYIDLADLNALGTNLFGKGSAPTPSHDRWLDVSSGVTVHMYATGESPFADPPDTAVGEGELESLYWFFRSRIPN